MRIAFLGKGGSGKTTLAGSFIKYLAHIHDHVLAIDADVNVHLTSLLLGNTHNVKQLGSAYAEVRSYLRGNRQDVKTMVATTPPSMDSNFILPRANDPFIRKFGKKIDNISLLTIGTYQHEDVGHTCYHGKLNTLETIYHHMLDSDNDYVIADATAGIDNLGTSLFFAYDLNIFVVEPTLKSIQVYKDFKKVAAKEKLNIRVIVNKCDPSDKKFVLDQIKDNEILGFVSNSTYIKELEQGKPEAFEHFVRENSELFQVVERYSKDTVQRNWDAYYQRLIEVHLKNSLEWWDDYYSEKISEQKDTSFSYHKVI